MAAGLHEAQFALNLCDIHDKKELIGYCKTCEKKICSSCIKEEHNQHDWETITDILREKKRSLPEECKEIRTKHIPKLKKELRRFDRKIEEENAHFERNESILNESRQSYFNEINRLFDDRIDECRQRSETAILKYDEERIALKQKVEYLEMITTSLDKDINTLPDHDIIDMEKEMRNELKKALSNRADKYTCTTVFAHGMMDVQALENMIGEIQSVSVEEKNDIDRYIDSIMTVKPVDETHAWVLTSTESHPTLLDRKGEEIKTMKTTCTDLILDDEEFLLTMKSKCKVSVLNEDEDTILTIDTKPLHPTFITKTENDDILVTLRDDDDRYNLTLSSRRIVKRMTLKGDMLHTYEFMEDGKTRLFTYPVRTAENKNTDICVINWLSSDSGELVVLHEEGRVRFKYRGDGLQSDKFFTSDVECDSKCRILLTEKYSKSIYMLSAEGMFLCNLCQYEHIRPYVISIHDDALWCGFKEGKIKVLKYRN